MAPLTFSNNELNSWQSDYKSRMAGDVFAQSNSGGENESYRNLEFGESSSGTPSKSNSNGAVSSAAAIESSPTDKGSMAGYVAPKPENWAAQDAKEYKGFTGGVAGVDSPDLNYGQVITSPSGTKTQYGADGSMKTWGTDEALESALDLKQRREYGKKNPRKIDYNTNLPSDFDPNGRDNATHEAWLCREYGVLCK